MSQTAATKQALEAHRVPAGNGSHGGEFGAHNRRDALADGPLLVISDDDMLAQIEAREARLEAKQRTDAEWAEILDATEQAATYTAKNRGQQHLTEDMVGGTLLSAVEMHKNGHGYYGTRAYIRSAVNAHSTKLMGQADASITHHKDLKARRYLKEDCAAKRQELGRELTRTEFMEIVEAVRNDFPVGGKPTEFFYMEERIGSLDETITEDGLTRADLLEAADNSGSDARSSEMAVAYAEALKARSVKPKTVMQNLWKILSEDGNRAPDVAPNCVHDDRGHRAAVEAAGGPLAVGEAWMLGDLHDEDPAVLGLFAPFGNIDNKGQEKVVSLLAKRPEVAVEIWGHAMTSATDQAKRRVAIRKEQRAAHREAAKAAADAEPAPANKAAKKTTKTPATK